MIIYKATNTLNGKVYIGQTTRTLTQRKAEHINETHRKYAPYFHNALKKNGKENFTWEEIDRGNTQSELDQKEKYWIAYYKSNMSEHGYNLACGGKQFIHSEKSKQKMSNSHKGKATGEKHYFFGKHHTEETKEKLRQANLGKKRSPEHRRKMSEALRGEKSYWYGKHLSEETRQKIREAHMGKPAWNKGRKATDEERRKNSESHKGIPAWNKGMPITEEARQKNRNAHIGLSAGEKNAAAKLTETQVIEIKIALANGEYGSVLARKYHVSERTIGRIKNGNSWKHCKHGLTIAVA
jgi:hypothetical protein